MHIFSSHLPSFGVAKHVDDANLPAASSTVPTTLQHFLSEHSPAAADSKAFFSLARIYAEAIDYSLEVSRTGIKLADDAIAIAESIPTTAEKQCFEYLGKLSELAVKGQHNAQVAHNKFRDLGFDIKKLASSNAQNNTAQATSDERLAVLQNLLSHVSAYLTWWKLLLASETSQVTRLRQVRQNYLQLREKAAMAGWGRLRQEYVEYLHKVEDLQAHRRTRKDSISASAPASVADSMDTEVLETPSESLTAENIESEKRLEDQVHDAQHQHHHHLLDLHHAFHFLTHIPGLYHHHHHHHHEHEHAHSHEHGHSHLFTLHLSSSLVDIRHHVMHTITARKHSASAIITPEGLDLDHLLHTTEHTFDLVIPWCSAELANSTEKDEISSNIKTYVHAIDASLASAEEVFRAAQEALGVVELVTSETSFEEIHEWLEEMQDATTRCHLTADQTLKNFKIVRTTIIHLISLAHVSKEEKILQAQGSTLHIENHIDILEALKNNISIYVEWWIRMSMEMDPNKQKDIAKEINESHDYSSSRKDQALNKWTEMRAQFSEYADKMRLLQDTYPSLYDDSRKLEGASSEGPDSDISDESDCST